MCVCVCVGGGGGGGGGVQFKYRDQTTKGHASSEDKRGLGGSGACSPRIKNRGIQTAENASKLSVLPSPCYFVSF